MLVIQFDFVFGQYRCYSNKQDWLACSGFGDTRKIALDDYYSKVPLKPPFIFPEELV